MVVHDQSPAFHFGTPPNWTPQERPAAAIMVASRLDRPTACGLQLASLFVLGLLASIAWHEAGHLFFAVAVAVTFAVGRLIGGAAR